MATFCKGSGAQLALIGADAAKAQVADLTGLQSVNLACLQRPFRPTKMRVESRLGRQL